MWVCRVLGKLVFVFHDSSRAWDGFFICICDFFCIVVLDGGIVLQGPQGYMMFVVCPRCRNDGTPAYVGGSRGCVVGPYLISL